MSNMKETCDLCNHREVCKKVEDAYALQDKVDKILEDYNDSSFDIDVKCPNFKENYPIGFSNPNTIPLRNTPNDWPNPYKITGGNGDNTQC